MRMGHGKPAGRRAVTAALVVGLSVAGCEPSRPSQDGGGLVREYRPAGAAVQRKATDSGEYVLWRWMDVPATRPANQPPPSGPVAVRVTRLYVHHGEQIGFRRRPDGLLVAVAGATTRPLDAGTRYGWYWVVPPPAELDPGVRNVLVVGAAVAVVAGVVAAVVAIDHNDRHAHLGKTINGLLDSSD